MKKLSLPELVSANTVKCPKLNQGRKIEEIEIEALVHSFRDGTTKVLCVSLHGDVCKVDNESCSFSTGGREEEKMRQEIDEIIPLLLLRDQKGTNLEGSNLRRRMAFLKAIWISPLTITEAIRLYFGEKNVSEKNSANQATTIKKFCYDISKRLEKLGINKRIRYTKQKIFSEKISK